MSERQDITKNGDSELSDLFLIDPGLNFTLNHATWETVKMLARACYTFTDEQLTDLKETYNEEQE